MNAIKLFIQSSSLILMFVIVFMFGASEIGDGTIIEGEGIYMFIGILMTVFSIYGIIYSIVWTIGQVIRNGEEHDHKLRIIRHLELKEHSLAPYHDE